MKMKRTLLICLLCLVLCVSLLPVSAFADETVIIIGGTIRQDSAAVVTQGASGTGGTTVVSGSAGTGSSSSVVTGSSISSPTSSVIVMPNGSVMTAQPKQTNQSTQAAVVTQAASQSQANGSQSASIAPAGLANEIFKLINQVRTANGLGILGYDSKLQETADIRAQESSRVFGHTRPDGSAAVTAVTVDYNVAGENLIQVTKEYATADIMVETWLASETHKANIMLADFTQTAIGVYESNGTIFVSQIFTD